MCGVCAGLRGVCVGRAGGVRGAGVGGAWGVGGAFVGRAWGVRRACVGRVWGAISVGIARSALLSGYLGISGHLPSKSVRIVLNRLISF